ncbi:hypothetical protein SETIT_1G220200v2 [Setaria italica]|uniref:Uncharacterized protein n=1 Tax=Setaria italica TaxID=4555 RepID=A0A368PNX7_SETIT|nr:hypothetical protein SETIT_1G220200v2 [Setaria italica]
MAGVGEALVSAVLKEVLRKMRSAVGEQIKARWKLKKDMESIKSMVELVQALLRDADVGVERWSVREEVVNLWLKMLKKAAHDISDMLDEFEVKLSQHVTSLSKLIHLDLCGSIKISTLPNSLNKLRNLLHLDLSRCCNVHSLPESFGGLMNLSHLNLSNCSVLNTLPESVDKLRNLLHLELCGCSGLCSLPESFELEIECLENVTSIEEADAINLANKSALTKLVLAWTPAAKLFPPENLIFLKVQGYMENSFSGWTMVMAQCLPHLFCIEMVDLPRCEHLPPFGQLQNLEKLGTEFFGGSEAFKKLRELTLIGLDTLEEWVTMVFENGEYMFPSLHKLEICRCPRLRLKPCLPRAIERRIQASDEVVVTQYDAGSSSSLTLSKLHILEISNYQRTKLPDSLVFLVSLRSLKVDVCNENQEELSDLLIFLSAISSDRELVVFPSPNLTALDNLEISLNDELQRWCKKHDRWTLYNAKNKPSTFFERSVANIRKKDNQSLISYIRASASAVDG